MTSKDNLEEKLHELSQAIGSDDKLVENVMNRIHSAPACRAAGAGCIRKIIMKHSLTKLVAAAVIGAIAWIAIGYLSGSRNSTPKVYAAMIDALHNVNTAHVTGWTTKIHPGHTTVLDTPPDTSKRYPIEIWEWFTEGGVYRMYDRQGPVTIWQDGNLRYEYRADKDTLYIDKYKSSPQFPIEFQSFTRELEPLMMMHGDKMTCRADRITFLADRIIDGRKAQRYQIDCDNWRKEIWFDNETKHMLEINSYAFADGQWKQWRHGVCAYDQDIPASIRAYVPPDTKNVRYSLEIDPRFEKWNQRLHQIAAYYQQHPLPETMELLPRESDERIDAHSPSRLPEISDTTGYCVLPIQCSLADFLRTKIRPYGSLRVPEELQKIKLNHDLVTKYEHTSRQRADFVLDALGLEIVEITEQCDVWIALYDGRPLDPWYEVNVPVARGEARHTQPGMDWSSSPHSMKHLLESFAYYQNYDLGEDRIILIDETGLPSEPSEGQSQESIAVSSASPYWPFEIAKGWFREQFGVTFAEEIRNVTIHLVRRCDKE